MTIRRRTHRGAVAAIVAATLVALATGCGGGSSSASHTPAASATPDPTALLASAKSTLDATSGLHFTLVGSDIPAGTTGITAGEGDAVRPSSFQGTLKVSGSGLSGTVKVISVDHVVYAKLPLLPGYHTINPANYGISDPGNFLNPDTGLSSLLVEATSATYEGQTRVGGVVLDQVKAVLPGEAVDKVLGSADASKPVDAEFGIEPTSHEIRTAVLTGPFFSKTTNSTFTLALSNYGETVTISAPS